jgi:hypothetical protein
MAANSSNSIMNTSGLQSASALQLHCLCMQSIVHGNNLQCGSIQLGDASAVYPSHIATDLA